MYIDCKKMQAWRAEKGLTMVQMGATLEVSYRMICNLLYGASQKQTYAFPVNDDLAQRIAAAMGVTTEDIRAKCVPQQEPQTPKAPEKKKPPKKENLEDWRVSAKACKGCQYYGYLSYGGTMCCNYTYVTGLIRRNKPSECEVKSLGKRPRGDIGKII